jgi:predicted AAA+ superfamily ATPase
MFFRLMAQALRSSLADTPATFVAGARQTGKSTLVQGLVKRGGDWTYRTFDDLATLASAQADPHGFVESLGEHAILDEVQRAPGIILPLKLAIDRDRRPGRFVLTGSANVFALPRAAEGLAGRMEVMTLWPLAQSELEGTQPRFIDACFEGRPEGTKALPFDRAGLTRRLIQGGYPEALSRRSDAARRRWFDAYLTTLVQRDLRDLANVEQVSEVPRILEAVAARSGGPLNVADLGRTLGLNQMTLRRYLALLEALFLLFRLPPWFENMGKRLSRTPKLYLNDAGLFAHLQGLDVVGLAARPGDLGQLMETFVVAELLRLAPPSLTQPRLHHLRTSDGTEVDVVLEARRHQLVGIEVKAGSTVSTEDFRGLRFLQQAVGERLRCGVVLYTGRETLPFGPRLWAVPVSALWSGAARSSRAAQ